jgi:hypothetical protein
MSHSAACAGGCGAKVRLTNGSTAGLCPRCKSASVRQARMADEARQKAVLQKLVRAGAVPRALLREVFG